MADLEARFRSIKQSPAPDLWREIERAASQREPASRPSEATILVAVLAVVAALVVLFIVVPLVGQLPGTFEGAPPVPATTVPEPSPSGEAERSPCIEASSASVWPPSASVAPSASMLPKLGLPGTRASGAGEFGWTGALHASAGMHRVVENQCSSGFRQTQLVFVVEADCFPTSLTATGGQPARVSVAGREGLYLEGHTTNRTLLFVPTGRETTGAYALPIDDRTLCVYLSWDPETTPDELEAARQVVESIRGEANGPNGIRIVFTLPAGWDIG